MAEEGFKRKLTAILSADVVGYSRLMEDNEEATIQTLNTYRNSMTTLIQQHRGRVVDTTGDNLMAEFSSVVDAVKCAVETQKEMNERNADLPKNRRMIFRIGVNLGDIVEEDDRIYGDGVNIAARLEGLAEAGGICISRTAYDQVKNKLEIGFEYLGEHSVKNISEPVHVYRVLIEPEAVGKVIGEKRKEKRRLTIAIVAVLLTVSGGLIGWYLYIEQSKKIAPASVENMAFPLPEKPSIAVLPFANMSDDPGKEYLNDGITEQIITSLSKVPRLFVISRTSTFSYKGRPVKVQQVAEELGVRYVLEGSIQQSGNKIRITAQLIDALTGRHLWAQRYERDYKDIFALQDEITLKILNEIGVKLTEGERIRSHVTETTNLDAYEKALEGVTYLRAFNIENNATARRLAQEAIALAPEYYLGYNLLAAVNIMDVWLGSSESIPKSLAQATELLQKAIDLDENNDQAYSLLCHIYGMQRQFDKAVAVGEKAIEVNPNSDAAYVWLAMPLRWMGEAEKAIELHKKAMRLCPFPPSFYYLNLGNAYRTAGRCEEAIAEYKKALQLTPQNMPVFEGLTICYGLLGREEESRAAAAEILKLNPKFSIKLTTKLNPYVNKELVEHWNDILRKAGIPEG